MAEIKKKLNLGSKIWVVFTILFFGAYLGGLLLCLRHPMEGFLTSHVTVYTWQYVLGLVVLVVLSLLANPILERWGKVLVPLFLLAYGIWLYLLSIRTRGTPQTDQASIVSMALSLAGYDDSCSWTYFARFHNNIMPMTYLSYLFRLAKWMGMEDPYYLALVPNILQIVIAMACVNDLCKHFSKYSGAAGFTGMVLLGSYIPLMSHAQSLYTDILSYCFGILGFTLWVHLYERKERGLPYFLKMFGIGILWAVAMEMKMTALIPMIAIFIYLLLFDRLKELGKTLVLWLIPLMVASLFCGAYIDTLPSEEFRETWEFPTWSYFIAIGMQGNGTDLSAEQYYNECGSIYGLEAKEEYTLQFIKDNISCFWDWPHMESKFVINFGTGNLTASDFLWEAKGHTFLNGWIIEHMSLFNRKITNLWNVYWGLSLVCVIAGFVRRERNPRYVVALLSIAGIMIYLMLGEANNRQLTNSFYWFIATANIGLWAIEEWLEKGLKRTKEWKK